MKLVGELKNKVEKTENLDETKKIIEEAGMQLSDEEMNNVAGGSYNAMEIEFRAHQFTFPDV